LIFAKYTNNSRTRVQSKSKLIISIFLPDLFYISKSEREIKMIKCKKSFVFACNFFFQIIILPLVRHELTWRWKAFRQWVNPKTINPFGSWNYSVKGTWWNDEMVEMVAKIVYMKIVIQQLQYRLRWVMLMWSKKIFLQHFSDAIRILYTKGEKEPYHNYFMHSSFSSAAVNFQMHSTTKCVKFRCIYGLLTEWDMMIDSC
jgi:hypothetical protein